MYSGNKPWSNYSFENQKSFFNFLSKTKKIPEIPNTFSKAGKEFINNYLIIIIHVKKIFLINYYI